MINLEKLTKDLEDAALARWIEWNKVADECSNAYRLLNVSVEQFTGAMKHHYVVGWHHCLSWFKSQVKPVGLNEQQIKKLASDLAKCTYEWPSEDSDAYASGYEAGIIAGFREAQRMFHEGGAMGSNATSTDKSC